MRKLQIQRIALFMLLSFIALTARSQVTIGDGIAPQPFSVLEIISNETGGLRLPQLTTAQRKTLEDSPAFRTEIVGKGRGLTIYNTTTNCVEYWNKTKWISLCSGGSSFIGGDCATTPVPATGGEVNCTITDPDCNTAGAYIFTIVSGSDYSTLTVTDAGAGSFTLAFDPNDRASDRQAIVMVTSPCGTSGLFVFTQLGDATGCGTTTVPAIKSVDDITAICAGGAVYLYLNGYPTTGTFIWTLNGQQVGTGHNYTATAPGKYIVYGDKIGCPGSQSIQITLDGTGAPSPIQMIVAGNNGIACDVGGEVELVAMPAVPASIIWFRDGILQTGKTGQVISAGKGYWTAVVKDGSCYSTPSPGVTVTEDLSGGSIPTPVMKINSLTSGWKLCRGGSLFLEVGTMEPGVTYTWYADNTQIGVGSGIYYPVPNAAQVVIRLRATATGCAQESMSVETISIDQAPAPPFISCNTPGNTLCGGEATLSATGGTSYIWFKDNKEISGQTGSSLKVTQTGSYTAVAVSAGGCQSVQSGAIIITASDFATLSWVSCPLTVNTGETKTYSVSLDFPQGATYNWTANGGTITNGQGTASITVHFPATGSATITCEAANACGTAIGSPLTQAVAIGTACNDALITNTSSLTPNIKVGQTTTLSVTATGTNPTYQWYEGTKGSGTAIGTATGPAYEYTASAVGSFGFYCIVSVTGGCAPAESPQFSVTVSSDPSVIPLGTGNFTGKTCFDIAFSNDNINGCAPLTSRTPHRTDFTDRTPQDPAAGTGTAPYTGVQVYTFIPSGTVSNVRFDYVDASGKVIESISGGNSGNSITGAVKATVTYKASLNETLKGLTRTLALEAQLYAIYNDGASNNGTDKMIKLTASLQDCACCGAATASGGWLTFMCHNLGADESLDPFTYVSYGDNVGNDIKGDLYQWGRPTDGHEKRNSTVTTALVTSNTPGHANFIKAPNSPYDWRSGGGNTSRWGDGTQNENISKAANDPCPPGWKVPSQKQWTSIYTNVNTPNKWTWTGNGYMIGDALYLPAAGSRPRTSDSLYLVGSYGYYWSSTVTSTYSYGLGFNSSGSVLPASSGYRAYGSSVRCVAE